MRLNSLALPVSSFALLLGLAYSPPASAQGFALDRFDPSERGSEWFVLDTLDMRGPVRPALGVVGDWGYKPLAVYDKTTSDNTEVADPVQHQFFVHVGGSISLAERIRLAFNLPIAAYQTGDDVLSNGVLLKAPQDNTTLGDLRLSGDLRLFGRYGDIITAAIGASVYDAKANPQLTPNQVFDPAQAQLVTQSMLTGPGLDGGRPVAAKAGSTEFLDTADNSDAWTVGYTPQVVTAVWVGHRKDLAPIKEGVDVPTGIWQQYMNAYLQDKPASQF